MADIEDKEQTATRGHEWEVVSLTASAYAAAPGPDGVGSIDGYKDHSANENVAQTSQALFMSDHFVFPPSEHENLPIEPDNVDVHDEEREAQRGVTATAGEGGLYAQNGEGKRNITGLHVPEVHNIHGLDSGKGTTFQGLDVASTESHIYNSAKLCLPADESMDESIHSERKLSSSLAYPANISLVSSHGSHSEDKGGGPELPPGAWWKRQVDSLCAHASETNAVWPIFIAAAVMGLVILGKQWQQERWQVLQQRWNLSISAEKPSRILSQLSRFKDMFVGGSHGTPYIKNTVAEH